MDIDTNFHLSPSPLGVITIAVESRRFFGLSHGFCGAGLFTPQLSVPEARKIVASHFPGLLVVLPVQSHSDLVVTVDSVLNRDNCHGDALYLDRLTMKGCLLGIRTADCVPLLISSARAVALVHAGWRGLANGIIQKTLSYFHPGEAITVLIGPCGGRDSYQVGGEVVAAIGATAVAVNSISDKFLLDMPATALNQIRLSHPGAEVINSALCTISDQRFNSHRRDGEQSGRNLSFIVVS